MRPIKMQIDYGKYGVKAPIEVGVGGKTLCSEQFKINKTCCVTNTQYNMIRIATTKRRIHEMPAMEEHIYCEVPDEKPFNIFRACLSFFNFRNN